MQAAVKLFVADTGAGSLVAAFTNLKTDLAPPSTDTALPYVVLGIQADTEDDTLGADASTADISFGVYVGKTTAGATSSAYLKRLTTVFHNQTTTVTENGVSMRVYFFRTGGGFTLNDDNCQHFVEQYTARVQPAA